jgi:hypothetical protein
MIELHMTSVPVNFIIMDMRSNTLSPIIFGRPFLRTTGAIIDSKDGNMKFQFPHKSVWSTSQGRRLMFKSTSSLMTLSHLEIKRYDA